VSRPAQPSIGISIQAGDWPPKKALSELATRALGAAIAALAGASEPTRAKNETEISLVFTDDARIRKFNKEFRGKDKPTNVLSFPQKSGPLLGDVILAAETVRREAALAGKTLEDHMAHLIIHGFLHLLGYDHEEDGDAETMEAVERAALKRMGIKDPYAAA